MTIKNRFHLVYKTTTTPFFPIYLIAKRYTSNLEELWIGKIKPRVVIVLIQGGACNFFFERSLEKVAKLFFNPNY